MQQRWLPVDTPFVNMLEVKMTESRYCKHPVHSLKSADRRSTDQRRGTSIMYKILRSTEGNEDHAKDLEINGGEPVSCTRY